MQKQRRPLPKKRARPRRKRPELFAHLPRRGPDKTFKDGRIRLANKSELRRQAFERAGGRCEAIIYCDLPECQPARLYHNWRCNKPAPWDGPLTVRGHLAHKKHGPRRNDTLRDVLWKCAACHLKEHGLRSGKISNGTAVPEKEDRDYGISNDERG